MRVGKRKNNKCVRSHKIVLDGLKGGSSSLYESLIYRIT